MAAEQMEQFLVLVPLVAGYQWVVLTAVCATALPILMLVTLRKSGSRSVHTQLPAPAADAESGSSINPICPATPSLQFQPWHKVKGLDCGMQLVQRHFMYLQQLEHVAELGLIMYAQSEWCKFGQGLLHILTAGFGSSVNKFVIFVFNENRDVALAGQNWPGRVKMGDLKAQVLSQLWDYEYRRAKIPKGGCTYYLYYVKKQGTQFLREDSWDNVTRTINGLDKDIDWARLVRKVLMQLPRLVGGTS